MKKDFKVIGFDADDTLWLNEKFYRSAENTFYQLLSEYGSEEWLASKLLEIEIKNIHLYGYGAKSFMLSMIETALRIGDNDIDNKIIAQIIDFFTFMVEFLTG